MEMTPVLFRLFETEMQILKCSILDIFLDSMANNALMVLNFFFLFF